MLRKIFLAAFIAAGLGLTLPCASGQPSPPASEETKTRPDKRETLDWMRSAGRMTPAQQNSRLETIEKGQADSKTPRSDFTFCMGLAHLGSPKAQVCVARAYEHGIGIVEDLAEAYAWYTIALENSAKDAAARERLQAEQDRIVLRLHSAYPAPTEEELEDLVRTGKNRISQYQEELKKARK